MEQLSYCLSTVFTAQALKYMTSWPPAPFKGMSDYFDFIILARI